MNQVWYAYLGWIVAAGLLGFAISVIFARVLRLPRNLYLLPYVGFSSLFLYAYVKWSGLSVLDLIRHQWIWGLVGAIVLGAFTVKNILSQPASARAQGGALAFDLVWSGVIYGFVDALLLSVLPVLATWQAFTLLSWTVSLPGKILVGTLGILASLFVTVSYHLGYPEYHGKGLFGPVIGNTTMTLGYLLTSNPLAAVLSHIAMHVAGVLRGPASVVQLPPHYPS
jgi:hypothetical protein